MFISKSFGYALRGVLYIALMHDENRKVQVDEIATQLSVPKHFLGKIMQQMVRAGLLKSTKGPYGGFSLTGKTLDTPLIRLLDTTDDINRFNICVLQLKTCNSSNPCPLHHEMEVFKNDILKLFHETTINDLLNDTKKMLTDNKKTFIRSISAI